MEHLSILEMAYFFKKTYDTHEDTDDDFIFHCYLGKSRPFSLTNMHSTYWIKKDNDVYLFDQFIDELTDDFQCIMNAISARESMIDRTISDIKDKLKLGIMDTLSQKMYLQDTMSFYYTVYLDINDLYFVHKGLITELDRHRYPQQGIDDLPLFLDHMRTTLIVKNKQLDVLLKQLKKKYKSCETFVNFKNTEEK